MGGMRKSCETDGQVRQHFQFESLNVRPDGDCRVRILGSKKVVNWAMQQGDREQSVAA